MGVSAKNLEQIMGLTSRGLLVPAARICDIGASQLHGEGLEEAIRSFLGFYARLGGGGREPDSLEAAEVAALADRGFFADLCRMAGFDYLALDLFTSETTLAFDLNAHQPGPGLAGRFDLVLNFGTTEHVLNQLLAQKTIYDLLKVGGIAYQDVPVAGYYAHGYFRYDRTLFLDLAAANGCEIVIDRYSEGEIGPSPHALAHRATWRNVALEVAMVRSGPEPFRLPLETATSVAVDAGFGGAGASGDMVQPAEAVVVRYPSAEAVSAAVQRRRELHAPPAPGLLRRAIARGLRWAGQIPSRPR